MANATNWLDTILYPFTEQWLSLPSGNLHYVDEGKGDSLLFVHGTPTWSFVWRQQIKSLSRNYRCIAPDHLGFGLSDKPNDFAYTPEAHSDNLERLIEHLQLKNITLVVHDFGGPIGLNYALRHPENVKRIIILNSWMWSLEGEKTMMKMSRIMSGSAGRFLYQHLSFSARFLLPQGYFQRKHLTKDIHRHYLKPMNSAQARQGAWQFAVALHDASPYFDQLWQRRERLAGIPLLIIWGEKDKLLPLHWLEKWKQAYPQAEVNMLKAGHFLQEENGGEVTAAIRAFLEAHP